jgi:hypothetical protein
MTTPLLSRKAKKNVPVPTQMDLEERIVTIASTGSYPVVVAVPGVVPRPDDDSSSGSSSDDDSSSSSSSSSEEEEEETIPNVESAKV